MRQRTRFGSRFSPILLAGLLSASFSVAGAQVLPMRQATPARDTPDSAARTSQAGQLDRMLLLLSPTTARQKALDDFLIAQQTPGATEYHNWLTASQFADRFGVSAVDAATVAAWLRGQGFVVAPLPAGRGWVEFSGTQAQVQAAFSAKVLKTTDGRYKLAEDAKIPAPMASLVKGLVSLDGSLSLAAASTPEAIEGSPETLSSKASFGASSGTSSSPAVALTPELARQWLKFETKQGVKLATPDVKAGSDLTGAGESIAIPSRSNIRPEDIAAFRKSFGLPESAVQVDLAGVDPGRTGDEAAALLAASWAGVAAPEARIVLTPVASTNATDGLDLALAAIVDKAVAHTVSVGYSNCENGMSAAHRGFYSAVYRQAAAQGMAVVAATGDSGAAACHVAGDSTPVSTGYGVNTLAATPWNTAVGGAALTVDGSTLAPRGQSVAADPAFATGGGSSRFQATPAWQAATGLPSTDPSSNQASDWQVAASHHRYLPDLVMPGAFAAVADESAGTVAERGLAFCYSGETAGSGCRLVSASGSAASAAIFAGVAAVLAQQYGPQGNLAPRLYAMQRQSSDGTGAITDVSSGSAALVCVAGSADCMEGGKIGFEAGVGYDLATGLGTVNAKALVAEWAKPQVTGTEKVEVEMTNIGGTTYNPSATISLGAKVISLSGGTVPTGTIQFYDATNGENTGTPVTLSGTGVGTYTETGEFASGNHNIEAIYSGDTTYESATSQPVTINILPSSTILTIAPSTTTPAGGSTITVTGVVTSSNPGATPPSGGMTVNLDGVPQGTATLSTTATVTSGTVSVTVPTGGSHNLQGTYSGDINYNSSTSSVVAITVAKSATVTSISATPSTLTPGIPETFTATLAPAGTSTTAFNITGSVSFYDGGVAPVGTLLGTAAVVSNTAVLPSISLSASAVHTVIAVYSGDATYSTSDSSPLILEPVLLPVTVTLTSTTPVLAPGQSATLTATVTPVNTPPLTAEQHPSGSIYFYAGTTLIGQAPLGVGIANSSVATLAVPSLPAGQYVITAVFTGDPTYGGATSNALSLQIEDFTITCSSTSLTMVQGTTAEVPCLVNSLGGLTGQIQVVCVEQDPPPTGAIQCFFTPNVVNGSGATTLTVITTAGNISQNSPMPRPGNSAKPPPRGGGWPQGSAAGGGVALAFLGLFLSPIGRRARILRVAAQRRMAVLVLLLVGLIGAGMGCNNSVTTRTNNGTPLGEATLKITAAAFVNTVTVSHNAYVTVNVIP